LDGHGSAEWTGVFLFSNRLIGQSSAIRQLRAEAQFTLLVSQLVNWDETVPTFATFATWWVTELRSKEL
jgi:uncharacterized protein YbaP (TraB family)